MGPTTRTADDGELVDAQLIGQSDDVVGGGGHVPTDMTIRESVARAVIGDEVDAHERQLVRAGPRSPPATGAAVQEEHR
jgi:hypothetical protein